MKRRATAQILPRMLTRDEAGEYCGFASTESFVSTCPIAPIAMGQGVRSHRWDVRQLDEWLDSMRTGEPVSKEDWLARL